MLHQQSTNNKLELLSPAKNIEIAKQAILHGADAVYIGGPNFGARHNAGNSVGDIAQLVEFAHQYYAKIFVTLNTILHDNELESARNLIWQLYDAGIDALIVQDMGILKFHQLIYTLVLKWIFGHLKKQNSFLMLVFLKLC